MADNVNETKARTIVLDSLKSTTINAGGSINLRGEELIVNGSVKRTYLSNVNFGNIVPNTFGPNVAITENQILNGLIVIHAGIIDKYYGAAEQGAAVQGSPYGNVNLPTVDSLRYISVNQSVDFSIINNNAETYKIEDNISAAGYSVIGHPSIYNGTSARFLLHRSNITNYNVYRLS